MTDTPDYIEQLQLNIWLSKSPMERLLQFLQDNEVLYNFWKQNHNKLRNDASEMHAQNPKADLINSK